MKPTKEVEDKAMEWARRFLTRYSTIPRMDILTYARALRRKARSEEDPDEAAWCKARAEALQSLLEKR